MQDLVIIGAGAFGEDLLDNIRMANEEELRWNIVGFVDEERTGEVDGVKILGKLEDFLKMDRSVQYFVADMDGKVRQKIMNRCRNAGFTAAVIMGKMAIVETNVTIGEGCYLGYKSHLMDGSCIGSGVVLEQGCSVCPGGQVDEYTTCGIFNVMGRCVHIGKHNTFAHRCTVDDNVVTADDCCFCIGSVVLEDTTTAGCYAGIPARLIQR